MIKITPRKIARLLGQNNTQNPSNPLWDFQCRGFHVDSREIEQGQVFFALKGQTHDGHSFLQHVAEKGVCAAIIDKNYQGLLPQIPIIVVDDTLLALQKLAEIHVKACSAQVIAVTGSIGKTTTKDFITTLLASKYKVSSSLKNQNSQVGLMLSLLNRVDGDEEYIVLEMGMTHKGNIKRLVEIIAPDIAVVTNIALVHAVNFPEDGLEGIAQAKAEIFSSSKTKLGIINDDCPHKNILVETGSAEKKYFSSYADSSAEWVMHVGDNELTVVEEGVKIQLVKNNFGAPHVFTNCLAAIACARSCGMSWAEIQKAMPQLKLPGRRLELVHKKGITFVDDSYNASEPSVKAALSYISSLQCTGNRLAIIGNMRELGKFSQECHARIGEHALECVDSVVCYGEECAPVVDVWKKAGRQVDWFCNFQDLILHLKKKLKAHDVVLLKGSRSNELWKVIDAFDEE